MATHSSILAWRIPRTGEPVSVFWWVELDLFSLKYNQVSSSEFSDVCGFGMALGSLYFHAQGCVPMLLEN